jgi:hypothetical protein
LCSSFISSLFRKKRVSVCSALCSWQTIELRVPRVTGVMCIYGCRFSSQTNSPHQFSKGESWTIFSLYKLLVVLCTNLAFKTNHTEWLLIRKIVLNFMGLMLVGYAATCPHFERTIINFISQSFLIMFTSH